MVEEEAAANMIRGVARIGKGEGEGEIVVSINSWCNTHSKMIGVRIFH